MRVSEIKKNSAADIYTFCFDNEKNNFELSAETVTKYFLYEKEDFTKEEISHYKEEESYHLALDYALYILSLKLYTEKEIRRKLADKGYGQNIIERACEYMNDEGYIDDRQYAQKFINSKRKLKPVSTYILKNELYKKGISSDLIKEILEEADIDDEAAAKAVFEKKFGKYDKNDKALKNKAYNFLRYRGFSNDVIRSVFSDYDD